MANLPPVRAALVPKGAHSASSAYSFLDIVKYDGKSYVCKVFEGITAKAFAAADWFELCSDGLKGDAATITIGAVTTGAEGSAATVTNVGTVNAAVLNIAIPRGTTGAPGVKGDKGDTGANGLKGDKGDTGLKGDTGAQGLSIVSASLNASGQLCLVTG
ncbi:MAG: collagen-like protein [Cloacibacillus sp.]